MSFIAETQSAQDEPKPWRLSEALKLPDWLELSGYHRSRYESLDGQFRADLGGSDHIYALQTSLQMTINLDVCEFVAEVMDSRQELADDGTPLGVDIVNTLELLQGYAAINLPDLLQVGSKGRIQIGRQTMDIGSRRLIARNQFRNTINSFTGIDASWTAASGQTVRAFYVYPVRRLPNDRLSLLHNVARFDEEDHDVKFWGVYSEFPDLVSDVTAEFYVFGLREDHSPERADYNRNLYTTGFRLYRKPAKGRFDFELESAFQTGKQCASVSTVELPDGTIEAVPDLDHRAHLQHIQAGYTFDAPWSPRLVLQFDYATGDEDPDDEDNNRFDTLYGARRFEFGPTGIHGPFARSNIISPGYRFIVKPREDLSIILAHRYCWLASDKDAWTTSGLRDTTGKSGSYVGNQADIQIRWDVFPGNKYIEVGAAYLFAGGFMEDAPNTNGEGDAAYAYLQTVFTF